MREKALESLLVRGVRKKGGLALKFVSPGIAGVPDRLVLLPGCRMAFVELKAQGEKMRPLQIKRKEQIEKLGVKVFCIDNDSQIGGVLDEICAT